jgi:hypothetical protein
LLRFPGIFRNERYAVGMGVVADRELLIRNLVRLRRAGHAQPGSRELPEVRAELETLVGPSVPRALAARVLGVSRTALDRRIDRGEVPVLITPDGRREVPVGGLVDLADEVGRTPATPGAKSALGAVLDRHQREADDLSAGDLLPVRYLRDADRHTHRGAELRALAYHRAVARRLTPSLVADARKRLARWRAQGRIHSRYAAEWERLLAQPPERIARAIIADSQRGRDLRQTSPFAGALTEAERRRVEQAVARAR